MQLAKNSVDNENGFVLITALMVMILVMMLGFAVSNSSVLEIRIAGGDRQVKQDFFTTESGGIEVYLDVDRNGDTTICDPATTRESCGKDYSVLDTTLSEKLYPPSDSGWGSNGLDKSIYNFRVNYNGKGNRPKGFGTDFNAYEYDITTQKGANRGTRISQGFLKIGPADNS